MFIPFSFPLQDCAEDAYNDLSVTHALRLLMFSNQQEFIACVTTIQFALFYCCVPAPTVGGAPR